MKIRLVVALTVMAMCLPLSRAQTAPAATSEVHAKGDISGDWQGTLQAQRALRTVVRITKADKGYTAKFYSIDQGGTPTTVSSVTSDGATVNIAVDMIGGTFEGTLSADGNTMTGTWSQGKPLPLVLVRATKETAWEIPAPPAAQKPMLIKGGAQPHRSSIKQTERLQQSSNQPRRRHVFARCSMIAATRLRVAAVAPRLRNQIYTKE